MTEYQIVSVWWPDGWEPQGPLDVPRCLLPSEAHLDDAPKMPFEQAVATLRGLNRQNMDHPGTSWCVLAEVGGQDSARGTLEVVQVAGSGGTTEEVRIVKPVEGGGRGDCSHCPAQHLPCAQE
jgi:hypothetical protein